MLTRVENTSFRSADDEPISVAIVYFYEEFSIAGIPQRAITVKARLDGLLPIEGWENKDDLSPDFHEPVQQELRASIARFIELRDASELEHIAEPRLIGAKMVLKEGDV